MGKATPRKRLSAKNRVRVLETFVPDSQAPFVSEEIKTNKEFVFWDVDNLFPQRLVSLADNSSMHRSLIDTTAKYIAGEGIEFEDEAAETWFKERVGSLTSFIWRTAKDRAFFNNHAWQAIYQGDAGLNKLSHLDYSAVRSGKINRDTFDIDHYWISRDWKIATHKNVFSGKNEIYEPIFIPRYDFATGREDGRQLYVGAFYEPDNTHYPKPTYMGCLRYVDLARQLQEFHDNQLKNSFMPSLHLHVPTDDEDDIDDLERDINKKFSGATNAGKMFMTFGNTEEAAAVINEIPSLNNTDLITILRDGMNEEIVNAHGMPPLLAGLQVDTGLGGAGLAIKEAQENFQNTKIRPHQMKIEDDMERILRDNGFNSKVKIKKLEPIDFEQSDSVKMSTRTINELRDEGGLEPLEDERGDIFPVNTQDIEEGTTNE